MPDQNMEKTMSTWTFEAFGAMRTASGLGTRFAAWIDAAMAAYRHRRAESELRQLSDAALKDIGIARGEIERVVREGRYPN